MHMQRLPDNRMYAPTPPPSPKNKQTKNIDLLLHPENCSSMLRDHLFKQHLFHYALLS